MCIFVCEDTRAVDFELKNDMTTEEFLQTFRHMVNRRGMSSTIHSDNQTTFHKVSRVFQASQLKLMWKIATTVVQEKLANEGVTWKFITERASHRGSQWERVCSQLKEPLRKVLGKSLLSYTEMTTVLTDIEEMINSRPLTYIGDDVTEGTVLTPALLAIARGKQLAPDIPKNAAISLTDRYWYHQRIQRHFWKRWSRKYPQSLTIRQKWTQ